MTDGLIVETHGQVLQIGLATADGRNEITDGMLSALTSLVRESSPGIAAIILHAVGGDFCGGRAPSLPPALPEGADVRDILRTRVAGPILALYDAIQSTELPVACFVQGLASGLGCAVVAACDYAVAASDSRFEAPELDKQFTPGLLMSALAGRLHAKAIARLVLTMRPIDAPTALGVGLISEIVEPRLLDAARSDFVALANSRSPLALAGVKRFLRDSSGLSREDRAGLAADVTAHTAAARLTPFDAPPGGKSPQRMQVGTEEIGFLDEGAGPPLILLHSLGTSHRLWASILPRLVERYRVIALDARGHGASTNRGGYHPEAVARDVVELARQLNLDRFGLVGISMGGLTAVRVAAQLKDGVSALVLSSAYGSAAGPLGEQRIATIERMLERLPMASFARMYVEQTLAPSTPFTYRETVAREIAMVEKNNYLQTVRAIFRDDVTPLLGRIDSPCLILNAQTDLSVPSAVSQRLADGVQGAVTSVVPDSRHLACIDAPDAYAVALRTFLDGRLDGSKWKS